MSATAAGNMAISVADRFSFTETEIRCMPVTRLEWWYDAVATLVEREKQS